MQIQLKTINDLNISIVSTPSSSIIKLIKTTTKIVVELFRHPAHSPPLQLNIAHNVYFVQRKKRGRFSAQGYCFITGTDQ